MMQRLGMMIATALLLAGGLWWRGTAAPKGPVAAPAPATAMVAVTSPMPASAAPVTAPPAAPPGPTKATARAPQVGGAPSGHEALSSRTPLTWPKLLCPPTAERLRAERQHDPQLTPPSFARYAAHWDQCMLTIGSDSTRAYDVFAHAEACVERAPAPSADVQALCLGHAQRLAASFSELTPRYHRLRANAETRGQEAL